MPDLKPELSARSKYWISKHRYYELKHYCLQYPHWKALYSKAQNVLRAHSMAKIDGKQLYSESDVEKWAVIMADLSRAMKLVERTCTDADSVIGEHLLVGVTEGKSYAKLLALRDIPCGQDMYYDRYRKFFYLLSQRRGI